MGGELAPGSYQVRVTPANALATRAELTVRTGETSVVVVPLEPARSCALRFHVDEVPARQARLSVKVFPVDAVSGPPLDVTAQLAR